MMDRDKEKFDADWELVNKIDDLAVDYLKNGSSPEEAQSMILNSDLYQEWISMERSFQVHYHDVTRFEDLLSSHIFEVYVNRIKSAAHQLMQNKPVPDALQWGEPNKGPIVTDSSTNRIFDRLFYQIGISITPESLAAEIGHVCKLLGLKDPLGPLEFLSFFTNNPSGLFRLELEILEELAGKEAVLEKFVSGFKERYAGGS